MHGTIPGFDPASPMGLEADWRALLRINLCYAWRHHRIPDLAHPHRFTELVQRRKLEPPSPAHGAMLDKLAAKGAVAAALGSEWTVPTAWSGMALPQGELPFTCPAILKAGHGCNQWEVLREQPGHEQWRRLRRKAERWVARPYGGWLDETAYRQVPRGLLAEPLLGNGFELPVDYKIYVFGGEATHVQVHLGRGSRHRWILYDRAFRPLARQDDDPPAPSSLAAMLAAAEILAAGEEFLRVDFYEIDGRPLFGEFCLYPGSGLDPFAADWIDWELGRLWLAARASSHFVKDLRPVWSGGGGGQAQAACAVPLVS